MTDWSKLKVAELKEECKARNIPLAGLKLKQQYIDKLKEYEASNTAETKAKEEPDQANDKPVENDQGEKHLVDNGKQGLENEKPSSQLKEATQAEGKVGKPDGDTQEAAVTPLQEETGSFETELSDTARRNLQSSDDKPEMKEDQLERPSPLVELCEPQLTTSDEKEAQPEPKILPAPPETFVPSTLYTSDSTQVPPFDLAEDHRKRKRRSVTPPPNAEEVARKKARANDGTAVVTEGGTDELDQLQQATDAPKALREADGLPKDGSEETVQPLEPASIVDPTLNEPSDSVVATEPPTTAPVIGNELSLKEERQMEMSRSPSRTPFVAPALHPATSSLYIRNFKRPLHIPTLKEHVINIAKSRSDSDSEPVKTFYLDSIRTHAFISFNSASAASRVRAAMHETRFPDEPQREPLFVDYIPDGKVQEWIDQETGGGFGRGGNNRRYEVAYNERSHGIEATLQDADSSRQRPSLPPPRSSISTAPKASISSGVHPDRVAFVPREERKASYPERPAKRDAGETGFKALDELFSFTGAKPKLYYNPVRPEVVDDRLDMIKGLRVGHTDMGRSGEEGMKRYTFEKYKGREEWVDKGPEFGHGQRGQAILRGDRGRGRGGFRGGKGDSWRGR